MSKQPRIRHSRLTSYSHRERWLALAIAYKWWKREPNQRGVEMNGTVSAIVKAAAAVAGLASERKPDDLSSDQMPSPHISEDPLSEPDGASEAFSDSERAESLSHSDGAAEASKTHRK